MKFTARATSLTVAAIATGAVGGAMLMDLPATSGVKAAGADLVAAMRARSPGERQAGALTTKGKRERPAAVSAVLPAAQGNPVLPAETALLPAATAPLAAAALAPAVVPQAVLTPAVLAPVVVPAAVGGGTGLLPLIPLIATTGGGGGGGGGGTTVVPPGPAPAIPEPATWAMMIAGFGLLGAFLRRRPTHRIAARLGA